MLNAPNARWPNTFCILNGMDRGIIYIMTIYWEETITEINEIYYNHLIRLPSCKNSLHSVHDCIVLVLPEYEDQFYTSLKVFF